MWTTNYPQTGITGAQRVRFGAAHDISSDARIEGTEEEQIVARSRNITSDIRAKVIVLLMQQLATCVPARGIVRLLSRRFKCFGSRKRVNGAVILVAA